MPKRRLSTPQLWRTGIAITTLLATIVLSHCSPEKHPIQEQGLEPNINDTSTLANSDFLPQKPDIDAPINQGFTTLARTRTRHSLAAARAFEESIGQLLKFPQTSHLNHAQNRWRKLFNELHQLLPLLHLQHETSEQLHYLEKWRFAISAWPIQPGYIDSYKSYFNSGIVNDINIPISRAVLRQQHGLTDKEEVLLGMHAIEYILWGEQGSRTFEHFIPLRVLPEKLKTSGMDIGHLANNRRRQLLALQTRTLVDDLKALQRQWLIGNSIAKSYHKLGHQQRLVAINHSASNYLQQWSQWLQEEVAPKDIDIRLNDFAGERLTSLRNGLKTINSIYLHNSIQLDGKLLKDSDKKQFKQLLKRIETELEKISEEEKNKISKETAAALAVPIKQTASLLKLSLKPPARIEADE